jgi:hypothetical protein
VSKLNSDAMNVDWLVHLADRNLLGTKTPLEDLPEYLQRDLLSSDEDYINVGMVELARESLAEEFGGISL